MDRCACCVALTLAVKRTSAGEWWRCLACGADRDQQYAAYARRYGRDIYRRGAGAP
jgi:hypothetical protein